MGIYVGTGIVARTWVRVRVIICVNLLLNADLHLGDMNEFFEREFVRIVRIWTHRYVIKPVLLLPIRVD